MSAEFLYQVGPWHLNAHTNQLSRGADVVVLEHRLTCLLVHFCNHNHQILSKEELIRAIWPNKVISEEGLAVAISQLRKALKDDARMPSFIKTIPGVGYQFIQSSARLPLDDADQSSAPSANFTSHITHKKYLIVSSTSFAALCLFALIYMAIEAYKPPSTSLRHNIVQTQSQANSIEAEANSLLKQAHPTDLRRSIQLFKTILETNPNNANSYLGIAEAKLKLIGDDVITTDNYQEITGLLRKALALNPDLAYAHMWLAHLLVWREHDFENADAHYKRSLQLNPNDDGILMQYAHFLLVQKRFNEARNQVQTLRDINPLRYSETYLVWIYLLEGNFKLAEVELRRIARTEGNDEFFHQAAQNVYYHLGDEKQTFEHLTWFLNRANLGQEKVTEINKQFQINGLKGVFQWLLDHKESADLGQFTPPISWARYAVAAGQKELAIKYLKQAFEERNFHTECAYADPLYAPLYDSNGFQNLISGATF